MNLPRLILTIETHRVEALVARSEADRELGLMHCEKLGADEGMLFIHSQPIEACYWMKNTPLDLAAAFIDDAGNITNVAEMTAHSLDGVRSERPVRFVLEMNAGWFAERGIGKDAGVAGLPALS